MCVSPINIVFASDKGYVEHLAVAMCSLFENNRGEQFDVYIVNADMDSISWGGLESIAKRYCHNLIDIKINDEELKGLVTSYHFTRANYYRLLIAERINVPKVLYLDADIVVNGSIKDLYNTNIDEYYLAGVTNFAFDRRIDLEMSEDAKYFNSGVMLINLVAWRRDHIRERVVEFIKRKPWAIQFVDQCGLNSVVNGRWKELHPKFNVLGCFFEDKNDIYAALFPEGALKDAVHNPIIIHFSGSDKPWHFRFKHPYRKAYWRYLRKTPYNHLFPKDLTFLNLMRWCIPTTIIQAAKGKLTWK